LIPLIVVRIAATLLILGAAPMPYGYYTLLRLVGTGVFAVAMSIAYKQKKNTLSWLYGFAMLLFNPFFRVHFPKPIWAILDVLAGVLLLVTQRVLSNDRPPAS
jgi:hypothetical protein